MRSPKDLPTQLRSAPAFTRAVAREHGVGWRRLAADDLVRPFHGVHQSLPAVGDQRRLVEAYVERMPARQFFSHSTAALLWGIPLPARLENAQKLHVSVPLGNTPPAAKGVIGHELDAERFTVVALGGIRLVDVASTWCQLGAQLKVDDLTAAADFLITGDAPLGGRPVCSKEDLVAAVQRHRGARGAVALRAAIEQARFGPLSRRETHLRLDLPRGGLPEPVPNLSVFDERGRFVAMVDLGFPEFRVGVEYQGAHHADTAQYRRDIRRLERLADAGWVIVQVTDDDVTSEGRARRSAELQVRVANRLSARGWKR